MAVRARGGKEIVNIEEKEIPIMHGHQKKSQDINMGMDCVVDRIWCMSKGSLIKPFINYSPHSLQLRKHQSCNARREVIRAMSLWSSLHVLFSHNCMKLHEQNGHRLQSQYSTGAVQTLNPACY